MEMKGLNSEFHLEREGGRRERKWEEREREEREREGNYVEPGEKTGGKRPKTPGNERVKFTISPGEGRGEEREKEGGEKGGEKRK